MLQRMFDFYKKKENIWAPSVSIKSFCIFMIEELQEHEYEYLMQLLAIG